MDDREPLLLTLCLLGCLWRCAVAQTPEILTAPEAQPPVPFNLDDNVTYTCTVRGNSLIWQVNDAQLVTPADIMDAQAIGIFAEVIDNMDETLAGTLQITVGEGNSAVNETRVRCLAVGTSTVERDVSDFVTLITFGIPEAPLNFQLTLSNAPGTLTIRWDPPTNTPPDVLTTHDVVVVNMDTREPYPGFPQNNLVLDMTILSFDEQITSCTPFDFEVTATNAAGTSNPSMLTETIPISPDVTPINEDLGAQNGISVSFSGNDVSIALTFRRAVSCSINFPVIEHIINVEIAESASPFVSTSDPSDVIMITLTPTVIPADTMFVISVTASTAITRRMSDTFQVFTTDVQSATVNYIASDNRVFLTCTFATGSTAQGCIFIFTLRGDTEELFVTREEGMLCNSTVNSASAYDTIEVVDWESDGSVGALRRNVGPTLILDEESFSESCPPLEVTEVETGLSGGQVAGIVIGVLAAVTIVAAVVIVLLVIWFRSWQKEVDLSVEPGEMEPMMSGAHIEADHTEPLGRPGPSGDTDAPHVGTDFIDGESSAPPPVAAPPPIDTSAGMHVGQLDLSSKKIRINPHSLKKLRSSAMADDQKPLVLYCKSC